MKIVWQCIVEFRKDWNEMVIRVGRKENWGNKYAKTGKGK